jgi:hypothetical protein
MHISDEEFLRRRAHYYRMQRRTYFILGFPLIWLFGPFLMWVAWDSRHLMQAGWEVIDFVVIAQGVAWVVGAVLHTRSAVRAARRRWGSGDA